MPSRIRLDINDAMQSAIGPNGLTASDIDAIAELGANAHEDLQGKRKAGVLGFYDLPFDNKLMQQSIDAGKRLRERFDNVVLLGIGGSSLGPRALFTSLCHPFHNLLPRARRNGARAFFPDNADPSTFSALLETLELKDTAFIAVTKSGGTAETWSQLLVVHERLTKELGPNAFKEHVVAVTDPGKGALRNVANAEGLVTLPVPPNVGGRFSVLSPVGLVLAAAVGIDVEALMSGAGDMAKTCDAPGIWKNPAYLFAAVHYLFDTRKRRNENVFMPYADCLREWGDWFVQIWAESLGKNDKTGPTPIRAVGATDQHSMLQLLMEGPHDKLVTFITADAPRHDLEIPTAFGREPDVAYLHGHTMYELLMVEHRATAAALAKVGRPSIDLRVSCVDAPCIGELIYVLEAATAFAGGLYGVNPFDQPGVEAGKRYACGILGRPGYEKDKAEMERMPPRKPELVI